ncbi:2Fe-2S iron-sulfur cluster-binding protein [Sinimarinibacterium sp. NLF-5-8]|uniref:2Fe-2S iron-sulfur cluster-binding protein n=1 Tax=Sinimarinibacterium sp. NLF-5-8 TaxID=2698684 RepID=UPI00192EC9AD|nr:2Fe-2S iron-sulfur cluster-binding protein [Sinimarinibacterium sp. NLF-5-8]
MNAEAVVMAGQHRITLEDGTAFDLDPREDSLLRGALRAGVAFPYECSVGGCGSCRFDLLEGEMRTLWDQAPGLSERDRKRGKRLACQSQPLGDCRIRVRLDAVPTDTSRPRRRIATLVERRAITGDMAEFTFRLPDGGDFLPGQYALLQLPGVQGVRAYSMSTADSEAGLWRFVIRQVPGGHGSTTLFERVAVDGTVELDGPYGHAWLRPTARNVVCVAGGSGLGPMLSIARGVLAESAPRRVHFFLGLRTQEDLGARRELDALHGARLQSHTVLSAPKPDQPWDGASGYIHHAVEAFLEQHPEEFDYYFAGPPPMIEAIQELLVIRRQVPHDRIHFDRFI